MAIEAFYPEMHEPKPKADGELRRSYAGGWLIKTKLELSGRGISLERTLTSKDLVPQAQHKVGWHEYRVTDKALEKLQERYTFSMELLLD
jgi:hypothetical protein